MQPDRYKTLAKDTVLFAISSFGSKIIIFLLVPLYTSVLTTAEYGIADLITTTVNLVHPILTLAISEAVLRFALDTEKKPEQVLCNALCIVVLSVVVLAFFKPLASYFSKEMSEYWWFFIVIYFLFNLHLCCANYIKGVDDTKLFAIQGILQTIVVVCSNIVFLLLFGIGLKGYLFSIILGYAVAILLMVIKGKIISTLKQAKPNRALLSEMIKYSIPMIPNLLAWWINMSADKYMIIWLLGIEDSGVYSIAQKIPTIVVSITSLFNQAWLLSAVKTHGEEDEDQFYTSVFNLFYIATLMLVLVLIPFSIPMAKLLFAKDFFIAWKNVPILLISVIFSGFAGFLASAFRATKKTKSLMTSVFIGALVNVVLNIILITKIGTLGAAIATMISFASIFFVRLYSIKKIIQMNINYGRLISSYSLLLVGAALVSFEIQFAYYLYVVIVLAIVAINIKLLLFYFNKGKEWIRNLTGGLRK